MYIILYLTYAEQTNSKEHVYEDFEPDKVFSAPANEDVRIIIYFSF